MITLRSNAERRHVARGKHDNCLTFIEGDCSGPHADGSGSLATLDEIQFPPGGGSTISPQEEAEVITYVYEGALAQDDSTGVSSVVRAGEFQRATTRRGIRHWDTNASRTDRAHIFRLSLHSSEIGLGSVHEQKRFTAGQRRNLLCVVASPDGRSGSLRIQQDALTYSSILDRGHHLVHELSPGRSAWLHIVYGEARLNDIVLSRGDRAGVTSEPSVSLTVQENTEILLVELGPALSSFGGDAAP